MRASALRVSVLVNLTYSSMFIPRRELEVRIRMRTCILGRRLINCTIDHDEDSGDAIRTLTRPPARTRTEPGRGSPGPSGLGQSPEARIPDPGTGKKS